MIGYLLIIFFYYMEFYKMSNKRQDLPIDLYSETMSLDLAIQIIKDNLWCNTLEIWNLRTAEYTLLRAYDELKHKHDEWIKDYPFNIQKLKRENDELQRKYEGLGTDYEKLYADHTNLLNDGKDLFLKKQNHGLAEQVVELQRKLEIMESKVSQFESTLSETMKERDAALSREAGLRETIVQIKSLNLEHSARCLDSSRGECICGVDGINRALED